MRLALRTFFFFNHGQLSIDTWEFRKSYFVLCLVMGDLKLTEERPYLRSYPNNKCNFIVPLELNITF